MTRSDPLAAREALVALVDLSVAIIDLFDDAGHAGTTLDLLTDLEPLSMPDVTNSGTA